MEKHKKVKKVNKKKTNKQKKIKYLTWNEGFELPDGWYSVSDIQELIEFFLNKHGEKTDNPYKYMQI